MAANKSVAPQSGDEPIKRSASPLKSGPIVLAGAIIAGLAAGGGITAGIDAKSAGSGSPAASAGSGSPSTKFPLAKAMLANVAAGIAPVLVGALAQPLAELATNVAVTPAELKQLILDNVVAPFAEGVSKNLGDAVSGALLQWAGVTSPPPATPSKETVVQVRVALQQKLHVELGSRSAFRAVAVQAHVTPDQFAAELADSIAKALARNLAEALARLPSSRRLDDRFVTTIAAGVAQLQLSRSQPSLGHSYTVQPGDSLWRISQQPLGPSATAQEIYDAWRAIYRDNRAIIGIDPNRIVPGQILQIPAPRQPHPA